MDNGNNKKIIKGEYGYLKAERKRVMLFTLLLFASSFGILAVGLIIWKTNRNFLSIAAVLGLLPAVRYLTNAIICEKAVKSAVCDKELADKIKKTGYDYVLMDLYMTSYDASFPIPALAADDSSVIGILKDDGKIKSDAAKAEKHITDMMSQNGIKNKTVKLFESEDKFLERVKQLASRENDIDEETVKAILKLMMEISL
ncbi:MAG: hypothetical protein K6C99_03090 [Lachnospiraceae bacterium]|nr:hypothetical protein [Lachnospiraceae bacterium]